MKLPALLIAVLAAPALLQADPTPTTVPIPMKMEVDAREISRRLLHARLEMPVSPGTTAALWYPKWIPGTHAPGGPVQNIAGMRLETPDGKPVVWRRDESEVFRILATIPDRTERLVVKLDYICNQPTVSSEGADSFGNAQLGVINWNTCLLYPETNTIDELTVTTRLLLPTGWKIGTALTPERQVDGAVDFKAETLRDLVDCPLICGEFLRTIELKGKDMPPGFLHLVSESASAVQIDESLAAKHSTLLTEAGLLYGGAHFKEYHFLVTCSDQAGETGVEHLSCSMNGVKERDLVDEKKRRNWWVSTLLPHEFSHSWCGKHRRPAGMLTKNFHTPEQTSLLWVYEGLDEYLGEVLTVRAGLMSTNEYLPFLASTINSLMHTAGRKWRPLEDTAIANHILRGHSPNWTDLRREQDYYLEGRLLWLEADAIIREKTDNRLSLDDFNRKFMGPTRTNKIEAYDRGEIVRTLKECAEYDWETFLHERVDVPQESLPLSVVERLGYRLQYSTKPNPVSEEMEKDSDTVAVDASVGLILSNAGRITSVVPGSPADKAGLAPGMVAVGVNARKFTADRMRDAVADSVTKGQVDLLVLEGDSYRNIVVPYRDGPKYLELVQNPGKQDLLSRILAPKAAH